MNKKIDKKPDYFTENQYQIFFLVQSLILVFSLLIKDINENYNLYMYMYAYDLKY